MVTRPYIKLSGFAYIIVRLLLYIGLRFLLTKTISMWIYKVYLVEKTLEVRVLWLEDTSTCQYLHIRYNLLIYAELQIGTVESCIEGTPIY